MLSSTPPVIVYLQLGGTKSSDPSLLYIYAGQLKVIHPNQFLYRHRPVSIPRAVSL